MAPKSHYAINSPSLSLFYFITFPREKIRPSPSAVDPLRHASLNRGGGGSLWDQRVPANGDSDFYDPDSYSVYRQKQIEKHGKQRAVYQRVTEDSSEYKQRDVGAPSRYLPGAEVGLRARGLF